MMVEKDEGIKNMTSLDARRGMPTIDVFAEAENLGKIPARKVVTVTIVK